MTDIADLDTPALLIDLDVLERNVAEMQAVADASGARLRPHAKTHKSPFIASMQLAAGAQGVTCAKLGEAEVMADAGIEDILIAYPLWGQHKMDRLGRLLERAAIAISLDSLEVATGIGRVGAQVGHDVPVFVEVDTGLGRCGAPPGEVAAELARRVADVPGVQVRGLLTHAGHSYSAATMADIEAIAAAEAADLVRTAALCEGFGLSPLELSVGSTPTARAVASAPGVTEIRPGTYAFNDAMMVGLGVARLENCALTVLATVVSTPALERCIVDAGTKALTSDGISRPSPNRGFALGRPDLVPAFYAEEHGVFERLGDAAVAIGDRLRVVPSHACATTNQFDVAFGVRGDHVDREIPIAARGKMR